MNSDHFPLMELNDIIWPSSPKIPIPLLSPSVCHIGVVLARRMPMSSNSAMPNQNHPMILWLGRIRCPELCCICLVVAVIIMKCCLLLLSFLVRESVSSLPIVNKSTEGVQSHLCVRRLARGRAQWLSGDVPLPGLTRWKGHFKIQNQDRRGCMWSCLPHE
jgi:hypothetical protein